MSFDPRSQGPFRFVAYRFHEDTATVQLDYALGEAPTFREEIQFKGAQLPLTAERRQALDPCLRHLHLVAGISYYKAAVPKQIRLETPPICRHTARFLDRLYLHGLGEFAYCNCLDLRHRIRFPYSSETGQTGSGSSAPTPLSLPRRTAVPVGGGKDSVVTLEALRDAGEPMVLISIGDPRPIREVAHVSGLPHLVVRRRISPTLLELNRQGALNGHVPISAIYAFILAAAAVLYGFDCAALSNERSADTGNLVWRGMEINHQYSKSLAFETDVDEHLRQRVLPGFRYFSFLRPFSELAISSVFSRHRAYHPVFQSCNRGFRLAQDGESERWCRRCPKCRFVFLALAPFLPKTELLRVFGANLLDDPSQESAFAALVGLADHRPLECVGEIRESVAAMSLLADSPQWRHDSLVRSLGKGLAPQFKDRRRLLAEVMAPSQRHRVPGRFRPMLPEISVPPAE